MPSPSRPNVSLQLSERARRHIARRLLPFLFVLYIANYLTARILLMPPWK